MGSNPNRTKGLRFELDTIGDMREAGFPLACSSRSESKNRDDLGVDLCYVGIWNIQCKSLKSYPNTHKILRCMPVEEDKVNTVFIRLPHAGTVVSLWENDWRNLNSGEIKLEVLEVLVKKAAPSIHKLIPKKSAGAVLHQRGDQGVTINFRREVFLEWLKQK